MVASTWLDHKQLMIIKGVNIIPGDTNSAEQPLTVINLLSGAITLTQDGWSPAITPLKNGGVWSDSPINDGRQLLAASRGNVIEKMTLNINGGGYLGTMEKLSELSLMIQACFDFWQTQVQIEPVYLAWWAGCGVGLQYALLYDIELSPEYEDAVSPALKVSVTLEREPFWRGLPPGANPKQWYYENVLHLPFNANVASFLTGTDQLASATLNNHLEWTSSNVVQGAPNYIDVPAASIPGDAPALCLLSIVPTVISDFYNYYVGLDTKPTTMKDHISGTAYQRMTTFNCDDAAMGTDATVVADTGGVEPQASATKSRVEVSYATATDAVRLTWRGNGGSQIPIGPSLTRGRYAAFLRCRQTAVTANDIKMYLKYGLAGTPSLQTQEVNPTIQAGAGNTTAWPITYMGIVDVPAYDRMAVRSDGKGIYYDFGRKDFVIELWSRRTTGASLLYACDLFLLPIDETGDQLIGDSSTGVNVILDNTGYFGHGDTRDLLIANAASTISESTQLYGSALKLTPHVNNRIHFLAYNNTPTAASLAQNTFDVRVNIVPRWSGIRSE